MTREEATAIAEKLVEMRNTQAVAVLVFDKWQLQECLNAQNAWVSMAIAGQSEKAIALWEKQQQAIQKILTQIANPLVTITSGEVYG